MAGKAKARVKRSSGPKSGTERTYSKKSTERTTSTGRKKKR